MASLSDLLDALRGLDLDGGTVAEALWLAKHIDSLANSSPENSAETQPGTAAPDVETAPALPTVDTAAMQPLLPREVPTASSPGTPVAWPSRIEVDIPAPSPLASGTNLLSELRPLARRIPDPAERVFDEDASVERIARTAVAWPVTRAKLVRQREAALVFDRHPSMAAWSGLADAVRTLVNSVGFRRVTVWYLDENRAGTPRLATHAHGPPQRPLSVLSDPSGRRVVMVFSACLGDAWVRGTMTAEFERLAARSPVAIVQPLPSSMWRRTGLDWGHGRITAVVADRPSPLRVLTPADARTTPIPVLELTDGWIRPWAQLLSGERRSAGYPLLRRPEPAAAEEPLPLAVRQDLELGRSALERVRRFRAASSPEAFRLAASLAQVPLVLPIMRLVQQAILPGSKRSVLAEVLAGGLIEEAAAGSAPPYTVPEDSRVFAFRPDVAEILRKAIPRSEAAQVLAAASRFIAQRYDVPGPVFRAAVSQPTRGGTPFAYLAPETLRRIAPNFPDPQADSPGEDAERRYTAAVDKATEALRHGDADAALASSRAALELLPSGHPRRADLLAQLIALLRQRWELGGTIADLDEAIAVAKTAVAELGDSETGIAVLSGLGQLLLERFEVAGGADFLTDATRVLRGALEATEPDGPARAELSERLGDALLRRSEITGEPIYAWEAVDLCLAAAEYGEDDRDRDVVLMFTIARAYLDIAALSAHPDSELEARVAEYFRYATAGLASPPTERTRTALLDTVARTVDVVRTGALPPRIAGELSSILATLSAAEHTAPVAEARRALDAVATGSGSGSP